MNIKSELTSKVQIKGTRDGLLVILNNGEWSEVYSDLKTHLEEQQNFLRGAEVTLDVGSRILTVDELNDLRASFKDHELNLSTLWSDSTISRQAALSLSLHSRMSTLENLEEIDILDTTLYGGEEAILVNRTLRSGFRIQFPGHVVVIGDVNPGAEIIAGGNVIVWGRLRGLVHAGAEGNDKSIVCALDLHPTQLRITDQIALTPRRDGKPQPEMARLSNGRVLAEPWIPKG